MRVSQSNPAVAPLMWTRDGATVFSNHCKVRSTEASATFNPDGNALGFNVFQNARTEAVGTHLKNEAGRISASRGITVVIAKLDFCAPPWVVHQLELVALVVAAKQLAGFTLADIERGGKALLAARVIERWFAAPCS